MLSSLHGTLEFTELSLKKWQTNIHVYVWKYKNKTWQEKKYFSDKSLCFDRAECLKSYTQAQL